MVTKVEKTASGWKVETVSGECKFVTQKHAEKRGMVTTTISLEPYFKGTYDYRCNVNKKEAVEAAHFRSVGRFNGKSFSCIPLSCGQ